MEDVNKIREFLTKDDLEPLIEMGRKLQRSGFNPSGHGLHCYVLVGYEGDCFDDAEQRLMQTIQAGFMPYAMLYRGESGATRKLRRLHERIKDRTSGVRIKDRTSGVHIKSLDLCDRCKINVMCMEHLRYHCYPMCPCKTEQGGCYCVNVKIGTPCDLFQEVDEDNT